MSPLEQALLLFRKMLDSIATHIDELDAMTPHGSYRLDWLQANWEVIVEGAVSMHPDYGMQPVFLQVYGEGADYYGSSSRILEPKVTPTHYLRCFPEHGQECRDKLTGEGVESPEEGFSFEEFVSWDGSWFFREPPFDHVVASIGESEAVLPCDGLRFELRKVSVD